MDDGSSAYPPPGRMVSQTQSPGRMVSQTQPPSRMVSQTQSPGRMLSQSPRRMLSQSFLDRMVATRCSQKRVLEAERLAAEEAARRYAAEEARLAEENRLRQAAIDEENAKRYAKQAAAAAAAQARADALNRLHEGKTRKQISAAQRAKTKRDAEEAEQQRERQERDAERYRQRLAPKTALADSIARLSQPNVAALRRISQSKAAMAELVRARPSTTIASCALHRLLHAESFPSTHLVLPVPTHPHHNPSISLDLPCTPLAPTSLRVHSVPFRFANAGTACGLSFDV